MLDTSSTTFDAANIKGSDASLMSKKEAKKFRTLIKSRAKDKFDGDWEFARLVWVAKNMTVSSAGESQKFYQYCGYNLWRDYCNMEVGLDPKSADRYVKVYQKYGVDLQGIFKKKHITHVTKMYRLISLVNEENVNDVFEQVKDLTAADFDKMVGAEAKTEQTGKSIFSFQVSKGGKRNIKRGLVMGRKDFGDLNDGEVMRKIVNFYLEYREDVFG